MTLDDLKAQFDEAKVDAGFFPFRSVDEILEVTKVPRLLMVATQYKIANEEGLSAAMLWKLQQS